MNFKALFVSAAMALGATGAGAATLSSVEAVLGGPTITSSGTLEVVPELTLLLPPLPPIVSPATARFRGNSSGGTLSTDPTLALSLIADLFASGPLEDFAAIDDNNNVILTGDLVEASDGPGLVRALFETNNGSAATAFGNFFVLELTSTDIFDGILDASSQFDEIVDATVYAVTEIAPIPLPAGVWLLLGGFGTLVAIRRRQTV